MASLSLRRIAGLTVSISIFLLTTVPSATAIQTHEHPEGYVAHQFAHLFFLLAMGYLLARLIKTGEVRRRGWNDIAIAAVFFVLWNATTMVVHHLIFLTDPEWVGRATISPTHTIAVSSFMEWAVYLGQMDYLLAVPGIAFLFRGVGKFRRDDSWIDRGLDDDDS